MKAEPAWAALRVAEQVQAIEQGGEGEGEDGKLRIPASYTPGITLIAKAGSEAAAKMQRAAGQGPWRR